MSDDLTEAVRRLKGLREDVERLKAARDEEGEIRLFIQDADVAGATDAVAVRGSDLSALDVAVAADILNLRGPDISPSDAATAADGERVYGRDVTSARWNSGRYNTTTYE